MSVAASTENNGHYSLVSPMEMHGRRQIFTNEPVITSGNILEVLNKALPIHLRNREEIRYLQRYLRGIQPILDRVKQVHGEINNKVVVNIANQIVTFKTAMFAGDPVQYVSRGSKKSVPRKVEQLNNMMLSEDKQTKDWRLAYDMFTCGVGYRLIYHDWRAGSEDAELFDEAPFEIHIPEPANTFVVRLNDVTKRVVMGVTYVFLDDAHSKVRYTVYTEDSTYTVDGTAQTASEIVTSVRHNFGMVGLVEYPCNTVRMGAFEVVLPMLDAYNLTMSNRLDGIEQFIQAVMVFEGVDITREQFLELKDLGALKLPPAQDGRSSRVYYLNEQLDQSQTQTLVNDMYNTILQIVGLPAQGNGQTSDSSNNGAMIIKQGWWNAEARTLETQDMWKAAETETLKIVLKICRDANALTGLRVSDVEPRFWRQAYEDLLTKTQSFNTLRAAGCPAIQAFTFSKLSRDPESDAIVFDAYQEERLELLNQTAAAQSGMLNREDNIAEPDDGEDGGGSGGSDVIVDSEEDQSSELADEDTRTAVCPICGKRFVKANPHQKYDSVRCRNKANRNTLIYGGGA